MDIKKFKQSSRKLAKVIVEADEVIEKDKMSTEDREKWDSMVERSEGLLEVLE